MQVNVKFVWGLPTEPILFDIPLFHYLDQLGLTF